MIHLSLYNVYAFKCHSEPLRLSCFNRICALFVDFDGHPLMDKPVSLFINLTNESFYVHTHTKEGVGL